MTLVLAIRGRTTFWILADRRLTAGRTVVRDDAVKLVCLESDSDKAIIGYAGLGATSAGTQPSDWMSRVLRGRRGTIEQLLGVLAEAGLRELPRHIRSFNHTAIAVALEKKRPAIYGLGVTRSAPNNGHEMFFTRYQDPWGIPPRIAVAGSGMAAIQAMGFPALRPLIRMARAYERGQIAADTVSDALAAISYQVHLVEDTVGPRSIVAWMDKNGTGGGTYYTGTSRDGYNGGIPSIANGMDVHALIDLTLRMQFGVPLAQFGQIDAAIFDKPFELDADQVNAELRKLPHGPDEKLK